MGALPARILEKDENFVHILELDGLNLIFKPQESYKWHDLDLNTIEYNSYQYNVDKVPKFSEVSHFIGGNPNTFEKGLIRTKFHSEGNSSDIIVDGNPNFEPVSNDSNNNSYKQIPVNTVVKIIKDKKLSDIVYNSYTKARESGLEVPSSEQISEGIVTSNLGENSYKDFIAHMERYAGFGNDPSQLWIDLTKKLIDSATKFSVFAENEIPKDDIKYIRNSKIEKLTKTFFDSSSLSPDFKFNKGIVEKNYFLFNLLKSIPGSNSDMVSILDPVAKLLDKAQEKFPVLDTDRHPSNAFLVKKSKDSDYKLTHIDFKNISYIPRPMQPIQIFDAFLPSYASFNDLLVQSTPFDPQKKMIIIETYLRSVKELTGEDTLSNQYKTDFLNYIPVCRFAFNLQLADKSLRKLSTSSNYNDIAVNTIATKHYIDNIYESIEIMKYQNENMQEFDFLKDTPLIDTEGLTRIVDNKFKKLHIEMVPKEVLDKTSYWISC